MSKDSPTTKACNPVPVPLAPPPPAHRRDFGDDEEAFRVAVDWQHARLRAAAAEAAGDETAADDALRGDANSSGGSGGGGGAGWGTFVVLASHGAARRTRVELEVAFSPASVLTVAHNRWQGSCFLVHASVDAVDALLLPDNRREGERFEDRWSRDRSVEGADAHNSVGGSRGSVGGGGGGLYGLLEGFVVLPSSLKLSPSLLDHGSLLLDDDSVLGLDGSSHGVAGAAASDADAASNAASSLTAAGPVLRTSPGKALHEEGLVVLMSPGSVPAPFEDGARAVAERWRQEWSSPSLDLHSLWFWSDQPQGAGQRGDKEERAGGGSPAAAASTLLRREWSAAARTVHSLAERAGVSAGEACGWDGLRVAPEGSRLTVRGECVGTGAGVGGVGMCGVRWNAW